MYYWTRFIVSNKKILTKTQSIKLKSTKAEDCYTPSNYGGYCMNFKNCPFAVQNQKLPEWDNYLRRSICGFNGLELMV